MATAATAIVPLWQLVLALHRNNLMQRWVMLIPPPYDDSVSDLRALVGIRVAIIGASTTLRYVLTFVVTVYCLVLPSPLLQLLSAVLIMLLGMMKESH